MTDLHPDDRPKLIAGVLVGAPLVAWYLAAKVMQHVSGTPPRLLPLASDTIHGRAPLLIAAPVVALALVIAALVLASRHGGGEFGVSYRTFLRGTQITTRRGLARLTRESGVEQVIIAGVPVPTAVETVHFLVGGSTGAGKSVLIRGLAFSALMRGDRLIVADPNGDMLAKFYRPGDVILNPFDARTAGWIFFNEVRRQYDFERYALSLVPRGRTDEAEEWCCYARLLLCETARKLALVGTPSVRELHRWTTIVHPDDLKKFLTGTAAESLFVGHDKALASARFLLSSRLPAHLTMPPGDFSLRSWLEDPRAGNLYITWREDMAESLRPLISSWIDALCTSILSLEHGTDRHIWMFLDELASLDKLPSLLDAATKGRKAGLRLVAGLQSTAQLDHVYGVKEAQTLRSCFRSLVVLGGAKTDPQTCLDFSKSLGEREVERDNYNRTSNPRGASSGTQTQRVREPIVLPSDIASLPDLTGYLAFAGDRPVAKVKLDILRFRDRVSAFEERSC